MKKDLERILLREYYKKKVFEKGVPNPLYVDIF
jgi:hypothetical protein